MKTFNTKLIVALFTTLVLTGCMPDSLTKFKKDAPKKAAAAEAEEPTPPITDGSGNAVDPDTLVFPTKFYYGTEGAKAEEPLQVGVATTIFSRTNGTLADPATRNYIFIKCEIDDSGAVITRTLPPGLTLNPTTCEISGTPTTIYSDTTPGNEGGEIPYTIRMAYKGADYTGIGTESSLLAVVHIGVYQIPTSLDMTQNDKLQIKLSVKNGALVSNIQTNTNSLVSYNRYGVLSNSTKNIAGVIKYVDNSASTIGVYKIQPIVVASTTGFAANGFISTAGDAKLGKILSVNLTTKTLYVEALTLNTVFEAGDALDNAPSFVAAATTIAQPLLVSATTPFTIGGYVSSAGKYGRVASISSTTNTIYVDLISGPVFAAGDALDNVQTFVESESTVTAVSSVATANATYKFPINGKVDNDSQYFTEKFNITSITQTYERGVTIQPISPILSATILPANGIEYSISPALPDGLSFNTSTGVISGAFTDTLDATDFTVTAFNDLGESQYILSLAAINSPKDLSYTSNQLISVNSNTPFLEGESLFQPIAAPLTTSIQAKILRLVSTNKLSIETLNGSFLSEASLDSGNKYYSEKNYVTIGSDPNYFNVALTVSSTAAFTAGEYVGSSTGAKGRIIYVDGAPRNVLYIQYLTPNVVSSTPPGASIITFAEGDFLDDVYPYVGSAASIDQVEAANMALTVGSKAGFEPGNDFTSTIHSGYVYEWGTVGNVLKVNEINRTGAGSAYLKIGQGLDPGEYYAGLATTAITGVTHDNVIIIDRNVAVEIKANVSQGTSVLYSISPSLPSGLTLNASTGKISGTPLMMSARKSYVVTATNLLDKSYYAFDMEVRDHFSFTEASGAKSFLTHKVGNNRTSRACRINAADILAGNSAALDIGCDLEAEELELFYTKLKLNAGVGPGVCEYIGFTPYSFWQYAPIKTAKNINYDSGCASGAPGATTTLPTVADLCDGNYTNVDGPNCDEGVLNVTTRTRVAAAGACDTIATEVIQCGGVKTACLAGPVTTIMSATELKSGYRSKTIVASSGTAQSWEIKSPVEFLDITNIRNANGVTGNSCTDTRADANEWAAQAGMSELVSPFGGGESPFYEFTCLDAAQDIKARIRLTVREWNRTFRITDSLNMLIPPKMNDTSSPTFGTSYNNVNDWDDDYSNIGHITNYDTCGENDAFVAGVCSDASKLTKDDCDGVAGTWTPSEGPYQFPEGNI